MTENNKYYIKCHCYQLIFDKDCNYDLQLETENNKIVFYLEINFPENSEMVFQNISELIALDDILETNIEEIQDYMK